jgi:hypothetical protein
MDALAMLLACGDLGAQRFHRDIDRDLRGAFGTAAEDLRDAVRERDDERALEVLHGLQARRAEKADAQ